MKRVRETQSGAGKAKKRVTHDTFAKWQRDLDRDCQTMTVRNRYGEWQKDRGEAEMQGVHRVCR